MSERQSFGLKIDLRECDDFVCPYCRGLYFQELLRLKVVSALVSPTGKDEVVSVKALMCVSCGQVVDGLGTEAKGVVDG